MADPHALPEGFVLDKNPHELPEGFVLNEPSSGPIDFLKSIPRGIASGLAGTASALGKSEANLSMPPELAKEVPDPKKGTELIEEHVTGPMHKPEGRWGQYGATTGEWLGNPGTYLGPGGLASKVITGTAGALGSEAAGQLTEGTKAETAARVIGGLFGANLPSLSARVVTPFPGRIPVRATRGESERSLTEDAFKRGFKPDWEEGLAKTDQFGNYNPTGDTSQLISHKNLSASDKVKAWKDFQKDAGADVLAPGGWKELLDPEAWKPTLADLALKTPTGAPTGITVPKATPQLPWWLDRATVPIPSVLLGGQLGGEAGALAGYAGTAHAHEGFVNPWLRNQLWKNQPSRVTPQLQATINALKNGDKKRENEEK